MLRGLSNAIALELGLDELVLIGGLVLLSFGLWPVLHRVTLAIPGAALVWMTLPQRARFIERGPDSAPIRRKR